uniref:Acetyltransf_18 domain-containing protein n=1 Tax=Ascaris lumbricoides TaxID=6252 RepID=A0A0M3IQA3_ASCLU
MSCFQRGTLSVSHLSCKNSRFGFHSTEWTFNHYVVDKPVGLQSLQNSEIKLKKIDVLTTNEGNDLFNYDKRICGIDRSQWNRLWLQHIDSDTIIAFDNQERVIGFGNARELAGGFVKRLLVGPLYANNEKIAAAILFALLIKYYNPENDHEWDPDVFAIYRRNVHFIIPEGKTGMLEILQKLKGSTGTISRQRLSYKERVIGFGNARELAGGFVKRLLVGPLYANNEKIAAAILFALLIKYYTQCTGSPPDLCFTKIFAASDLHLGIV